MSEKQGLETGDLENGKFNIKESPIFYEQETDLIAQMIKEENKDTLESINVHLRAKIENHFNITLKNKKNTSEEVQEKLFECDEHADYIQTIINTQEEGETRSKLESIHTLIYDIDTKLRNKLKRIQKKEDSVPENTEIPTLPPVIIKEQVLPEEITSKKEEVQTKAVFQSEMFTESSGNLKDAKIEPKAVINTVAPEIKPSIATAESGDPKKFNIQNLDDIASFIKNDLSETDSQIPESLGNSIFNRAVKILERASREAKSSGKIKVEELKSTVKTIWLPLEELLITGDIRENIKINLIQDLSVEFQKLTKALDNELIKIQKKEDESLPTMMTFEEVENFVNEKLFTMNINANDGRAIFDMASDIINKEFDNIKGLSEAEIKEFESKIFSLRNSIEYKYKTEKDKNKIIVLDRIKKTLEGVLRKIGGGTKNIDNKTKEGSEAAIKSIDGISNFIRKELPTIDEDKLKEKNKEITTAIVKEFELLQTEDDMASVLILKGKAMKIKAKLNAVEYSGKRGEFADSLLKAIQPLISALEKFNSKETTPAASTTVNIETSAKKEEVPVVEKQEKEPERGIDSMIDTNESGAPHPVPEKIKKDREFNSWLERMFNKGYVGESQTLENWHKTFEEQKVLINKIKEIFSESKIETELLKNFETKGDKEYSKKKAIEKLEFALLTDPNGENKVISIIDSHGKTKTLENKTKELESKFKGINDALKVNIIKLPAEVVFDILHDKNADLEKIKDLDGFLTDMSFNYSHYRGNIENEEKDTGLEYMFTTYSSSRKNPSEYKSSKIKGYKKLLAKGAMLFSKKETDYEDKKTFRVKIQALKNVGVVETKRLSNDKAQDNMFLLKSFVTLVKNEVEKGKSINEAVEGINEPEAKELFTKMFPQYIESISNNDRMQSKAKSLQAKEAVETSLDVQINDLKKQHSKAQSEMIETIVGNNNEREEFETMIKQELTSENLNQITKKLAEMDEKKTFDAKTLDTLTKQFQAIKESDAEYTAYKKVLLLLAQAEVKFIGSRKEFSMAPESMDYYSKVFESDEISAEKKTEYADSALNILKNKLAKPTLTISEQLELKRFIKYFEDIKKTF